MKSYKTITLTLFLLLTFTNLKAQKIKWFVGSNIGVSKLRLLSPTNPQLPIETTHHWRVSWGATGGIQYKCSPSIFLESGFSLLTLKNKSIKRLLERETIENSQVITYEKERRSSISTAKYFAIPVSVLIRNKKIGFRVGFKMMYLLNHGAFRTPENLGVSPISTFPITLSYPWGIPPNLKKLDVGLIWGLHYKMLENISLDFKFYSNFIDHNDIFYNKREELSIGLSYYLLN